MHILNLNAVRLSALIMQKQQDKYMPSLFLEHTAMQHNVFVVFLKPADLFYKFFQGMPFGIRQLICILLIEENYFKRE